MSETFGPLRRAALDDPKAFQQAHGDVAYAAWKRAHAHYSAMAEKRNAIWKRSDLEALVNDNWPVFVKG